MSIQVKQIPSIPFEENAFLIFREGSTDCVLIDPGMEPKKILKTLEKDGFQLRAIFCTHGHADHIAGITLLRERFPEAVIVIGSGDADKLTDARKNLSADFGIPIVVPPADVLLTEDRQTLEYAGIVFEALATPGHSEGHYVYYVSELVPNIAFVGDLIFYHSVGRSDFFDGSIQELEQSVRQKIYTLADDTILYCGHGPNTLVGTERKTNPFFSE